MNIALHLLLTMCFGLARAVSGGTVFGTNMLGLDAQSVFECPWSEPMHDHVQRMVILGYNYVRVPVASEYVDRDQWEQLDDMVAATKGSGTIDVALELRDDACVSPGGGDPEACLRRWGVLLRRFHGFSNFKMVSVVATDDTAVRVLGLAEAAFPQRFEYVVGQGLLRTGATTETDIAQSRIHYAVLGERVVADDGAEPHRRGLAAFPAGFQNMIDFSCSHNITDSFIGTYAGASSGGILADECIAVHDWAAVDLQQQFWAIVNSLLRDARQIEAPGSPNSVTGTGFATNSVLIY
jgi:hypothetical protein